MIDKLTKYWYVLFVPIMIYGLIKFLEEKQDIENNKEVGYGKIYRSRQIPNKWSKRKFDFEFVVGNKKYKGTNNGYISDGIEVGNFYQVEYSKKNPEHNRMDFKTEYFQKIQKDEFGNMDTIYVPESEYKPQLPKEIENRIKKIKSEK